MLTRPKKPLPFATDDYFRGECHFPACNKTCRRSTTEASSWTLFFFTALIDKAKHLLQFMEAFFHFFLGLDVGGLLLFFPQVGHDTGDDGAGTF